VAYPFAPASSRQWHNDQPPGAFNGVQHWSRGLVPLDACALKTRGAPSDANGAVDHAVANPAKHAFVLGTVVMAPSPGTKTNPTRINK